jgi:hypothetical protein
MATPVKLADISKYLGYGKLADFSKDWKELSAEDKEQLKSGIVNGTLTY